MKITDIEIKNIRSYKYLKTSVSPYLTVLRGRSDCGKSAFIKALMFAIKNHSTKNTITKGAKDDSFISISDGSKKITRLRDGKTNGYNFTVNDKTKHFEALGKQIPIEIQQVLNLSEANIQEQRDTYFLIDESEGQISKALNKVSGLSEIDRVLKLITTEINTINSDIRGINSKISEDKEKIENTKWSLKAKIELESLELLEEEITNLEKKISNLEPLLNNYQLINTKISNMIPTSIIDDFEYIEDLEEDIIKLSDTYTNVNSFINAYIKTKDQIESIEVIDLSELFEIVQSEIDQLSIDVDDIEVTLTAYSSVNKSISLIDEKITDIKNELRKYKYCPLCKNKLI